MMKKILYILLFLAMTAYADRQRYETLRNYCVLQLKCNDNADSNVVLDSSPYGNHATMHAIFEGFDPPDNMEDTSYSHVTGLVGSGAFTINDFPLGNFGIIQIPDCPAIQFGTGSYTVCFWLKSASLGSDKSVVFYKGDELRIHLQNVEGSDIDFSLGIGDNIELNTSHYADDTPHMITMVRDCTAKKAYIYNNAVLDGPVIGFTSAADVSYAGSDIFIGAPDGSYEETGKHTVFVLDNFMLFNRALTQAEISWLYVNGEDMNYLETKDRNRSRYE